MILDHGRAVTHRGSRSAIRGSRRHFEMPSNRTRVRRFLRAWTLLTGGLIFACLGPASRAQYRSDVWTADNGLPQNIVRGIVQTPDGYLWIATLDGVARFDGVRFTIFNKSNTPGISSNRFGNMLPGANGDLWLQAESGQVTRYHRGSFSTYGAAQGLPVRSVHALATDPSGQVWLLLDNKVAKWVEASDRFVDITPRELQLPFRALLWSG